MKIRLRSRSAAPAAVPAVATLQELPDLPLARLAHYLDARSLARLRCTVKDGLIPPDAVAATMRGMLEKCDSVPPEDIVSTWNTRDWLLHAQMAELCTECPVEEVAYNDYVARYAPSQWKWLRLRSEAAGARRMQGWLISEDLDKKRDAGLALQSLDLSALFFPPFPAYETSPRDLPVRHLRFSTAVEPDTGLPDMPLTDLFANTPQLLSLELVPKKPRPLWSSDDGDFPLRHFCTALTYALESPHAPLLRHLRLDLSAVDKPVTDSVVQALTKAAATRQRLTQVHITWPAATAAGSA